MILQTALIVMCLITSIKVAFKQAIQSGKIFKHNAQILDPTPQHQPRTSRQTLLSIQRAQNMEYWSSLKLQGKLAKLARADHSVSHTIYNNANISEEILIFCIKARLQVLPTKYNLSLWFPSIHSPHCMLHDPPQHPESVAHIMNSCPSLKDRVKSK